MPTFEILPRHLRFALGIALAAIPLASPAQDAKPPVPPAVPPVPAAGAIPVPRVTNPGVMDANDPNAGGAAKLPAQPGSKNEPLFIPDIPPQGPTPLPPQALGGGSQSVPKPPLQRIYTVGRFIITYGTDVRERNKKLPNEEKLAESDVTLTETPDKILAHMPQAKSPSAAKHTGGLFATTTAEQNDRSGKSDEDLAIHPPMPAAETPEPAPAPGAKPAKKDAPKADKNLPKAIPKPFRADGRPVKLKVSEFGPPRAISAMALMDIYDAVVKKLNDRGLIGVYILADVNPLKGVDERQPGVMDVKIQVFISEVAKIRTIARKLPLRLVLPKINDDDAPDGQPNKDPKHAWIKAMSPVKPGQTIEKPRLQDYLTRLNRFPGRRVDAAINATGDTGKVMLDYLIREPKNYVIYAQETNNGTKSTGEWRSRIGAEVRQLLNKDDILRAEYTTTDFNRFNSAILSYQMALLKPDKLKLRVYGMYGNFSAQDVGFAGANFTGDSITGGAALTWTPKYWHNFPIDITAGGEYMRVTVNNAASGGNSAVDFWMPYLGLGTERVTEKFSLSNNWQIKGAFARQNQDQLNGLGRFATDGAFWFVNMDLAASIYLEPLILGKNWGNLGPDGTKWTRGILANEIALMLHSQYALGNRRLIPQLELINGGTSTVRGYPEAFTSGDSGFAGSLEYRLHIPRLFKPADAALRQKIAKDNAKKAKDAAAGGIAKNAAAPKPDAAQADPVVEPPNNSRGGASPSFRLRPGGAGSGADWDLIVRGFLDYGQTYNNRIQSSVEANRTLMSTGGGIELQIFKPVYMTLRADYGYVLQSQTSLLVDPVHAGDSRIHVSATIAW